MPVAWTQHRFSGGVLALDTTNTVVLRCDPSRRFDRFDDPVETARFAAPASVFRRDEVGRPLAVADAEAMIAGLVRQLRNRSTRCFAGRPAARPRHGRAGGMMRDARWRSTAATNCWRGPSAVRPGETPLPFETALAVSALSLLGGDHFRKVKICPSCTWLFLDKSRNSSRLWCDMAVCGNQAKARQHYRRQKLQREKTDG